MQKIKYLNENGDFILRNAERYNNVYLPLVNEGGMISSVTPMLAGDCKSGQYTFLMAPASEESLRSSCESRNFWIRIDGEKPWSVCGQSAYQKVERFSPSEEETVLTAGLLWQRITRENHKLGIKASTLSFVPAGQEKTEIMQVAVTNTGSTPLKFRSVGVVPLYGRSADNIRDHRHVTSLLHRAELRTHGIDLTATLTFNERGHQPGQVTYRVWGGDETGAPPQSFIPLARDFVGTGSWDHPQSVAQPRPETYMHAGQNAQGGEMAAAMFFPAVTLAPNETRRYQIVLSIDGNPMPYLTPDSVDAALEKTKQWWQSQAGQRFRTGNKDIDAWLIWTAIQPTLKRICGCSFLPHHDYGRGGRGWRDLWQDSLALLLSNPDGERDDLLNYFAGVRTDGTNATIIGTKAGEFKADRNNIPRVWMDHGFWPLLTAVLYLDETGDDEFLFEEQRYFSDTLPWRGEWERMGIPAEERSGTILEHLLVQLVTAFYDVGEHGFIRLRGADWNDGLDMAVRRGESVAFTAAYAYGFDLLAGISERLERKGHSTYVLSSALIYLLNTDVSKWKKPAETQKALLDYCARSDAAWKKTSAEASRVTVRLRESAQWLRCHINESEWVGDGVDLHWYNSYYDNNGWQVEGLVGETVRMMLTGQVFTVLSGTADDDRIRELIRAADWYLFQPQRGGYCLNTDFGEVKLDMGRMFGFAYGNKENGAVFCHMAVMYAYALYTRGLAHEGWKVLRQLYRQCEDLSRSETLPGIPEYFDINGRGMYPYLTGAASWLLLTVQTQAFGVRGHEGDLMLDPKLTKAQFDDHGNAEIECTAAGRRLRVRYENPVGADYGEYLIDKVVCDEKCFTVNDKSFVIPKAELPQQPVAEMIVTLALKEKKEGANDV